MKTHEENQITNAMTAIHKLKIEDWVRTFNEPNGFMFTNHENINKLMKELENDSHSGCSAALTLRECQKRLKNNYDKIMMIIKNDNIDLYKNMDDNNKKACDIILEKGINAGIEHMFKNPVTGKEMSYAEMRSFYG